ncbi:MAG: tRNA lysidine(34) synthetase TilS, partial [Gammaproteobacteria bacterium]|nr:tRNA lysidine(34) synthetase TilS [Gammaproteobacteria bacterium]
NSNICIGLSGGVDSVVLLHLLNSIDLPIKLCAVHINHGISPNADNWAQFCRDLCTRLNIMLHIETITLKRAGGESLENMARIARHNVFLQNNASIIALAHHQNDQVETVLSQLFRGSDLHNIAAMHIVSQKQDKLLWRPLLGISRSQIEAYAAQFDLPYITDESNFDTKYLRNFVRHNIMPVLNNWDNNITGKILNFNEQLQKLLAITDEVGTQDLATCCLDSPCINVNAFGKLSNERQINLLGLFIKSNHLPLPGHKQLSEFVRQALNSNWDRKPSLKLDTHTILVKEKNNIGLRAYP